MMQLQSRAPRIASSRQKPGRGNEGFFPRISEDMKLCHHFDPRLLTSEAMTEGMYAVHGVLLRRVLGN